MILLFFIQGALLQVSQAAAHANDSMKRIEQFKKLLEVQESIGGGIDLVSPTREVLKEGKMVKISARTGDHQDRYLFLVTKLTHNPMNWENFIFLYFSWVIFCFSVLPESRWSPGHNSVCEPDLRWTTCKYWKEITSLRQTHFMYVMTINLWSYTLPQDRKKKSGWNISSWRSKACIQGNPPSE